MTIAAKLRASQRISIAIAFLVALAAREATAQDQSHGAAEFVTVALVPDLAPKGGDALIERHASGDPKNLILLRTDNADEIMLATALASLFKSRHKAGDVLASNILIRVTGRRLGTSMSTGERAAASAHFARLKSAKPRPVPGHGTVPAIRIPMGPLMAAR